MKSTCPAWAAPKVHAQQFHCIIGVSPTVNHTLLLRLSTAWNSIMASLGLQAGVDWACRGHFWSECSDNSVKKHKRNAAIVKNGIILSIAALARLLT